MAQAPSSQRPKRVPKPSQKVRASTSINKAATKKSKKRTSKEVSKTAKKRRVEPPVSEVVDDDECAQVASQEQHTDEDLLRSQSEPEDEPMPQTFDYTALWRVEDAKKEVLSETVRRLSSLLTITPLDDFKAWYEAELLEDLRDYKLKKVVLAAGHEKRVEGRWIGGSHGDLALLVKQLIDWHLSGVDGLQMSYTARVELTPTALAASQFSQTPARRSGGSTTQRMLNRLPDTNSELESEGNYAARITARWICKLRDCRNYGKVCWWGIKDTVENHTPVQGVHMEAWQAACGREELTEESPGDSLTQQMIRHHNRKIAQGGGASRAAATPAAAPAGTHFSFAFNGAASHGSVVEQRATASVSSPILMPSTQSSAVELREEFMEWLFKESSWRSEHRRLEQMQLQLDEAGFDLEGIADCTAETWKEAGLPVAYRRRIKTAAKRWLFERVGGGRSRRSRSRSSDENLIE
jgi:hypothetical protein